MTECTSRQVLQCVPLGEGRALRGTKMMATLWSRRLQSKETASVLVLSRQMATGGLRVQKITLVPIIFHSNTIFKNKMNQV